MSLLSEALRLREGRLFGRKDPDDLPPFPEPYKPRPWRWILGTAIGCVVTVWVGMHAGKIMDKLEEFAGISTTWSYRSGGKVVSPPEVEMAQKEPELPLAPAKDTVAVAQRKEAKEEVKEEVASQTALEPKQEEQSKEGMEMTDEVAQTVAEGAEGLEGVETAVAEKTTAKKEVAEATKAEKKIVKKEAAKVVQEGSRLAVADSGSGQVKAAKMAREEVAEAPKVAEGPKVEVGVKKKLKKIAKSPAVVPPAATDAAPTVAKVPAGGLQPMKVVLDQEQVLVEDPVERERLQADRVETFLRSLNIQGVRLQGKESRIMVDGVAIGVGEKVGAMGLVLERVESQKLIFSDSGGNKYPKSY